MKYFSILCCLWLAASGFATTYFIDYAAGNDANAGTSTGVPWQRAPGMAGFSGSYTHSSTNDAFIFKGGVVWSNACFAMVPTTGGSSASVRDYYGVSNSWYSGGSWSRPVFDAGLTNIGNGAFIGFGSTSNTIVDNIEMRGYYWTTDGTTISYLWFGGAKNILVSNCYLHGWDHSETAGDDLLVMGSSLTGDQDWGDSQVVSNCVFADTRNSASGCVWKGGGTLLNCLVTNMPNGFLPRGIFAEVSGCTFARLVPSFSGSHPNAVEDLGITGEMIVRSNLFHDLPLGVEPCFIGGYANAAVYKVYNNVLWNCAAEFQIETRGTETGTFYYYHNTIFTTNDLLPAIEIDAGTAVYEFNWKNNHIIGGSTIWSSGASFTTIVTNAGIWQTWAAAQTDGFSLTNYLQPIATSDTIDVGSSLAAIYAVDRLGNARDSTPDAGAYEYVSGEEPPTPTITTLRAWKLILR